MGPQPLALGTRRRSPAGLLLRPAGLHRDPDQRPGIAADHQRRHGGALSALQIADAAAAGDAACADSLARWQQRLARGLAAVINLLDPDVIVLGGGLSRMAGTYAAVPALWDQWVVSGGQRDPVRTRLLPALHGDASGVRGAAWLGRSLVG